MEVVQQNKCVEQIDPSVSAHFQRKCKEIVARAKEHTSVLVQIVSDEIRRGPGVFRVMIKTPNFDQFTTEKRETAGKSMFFCDILSLKSKKQVDEMQIKTENILNAVGPSFPLDIEYY